jgi:cyclic pyranopterin phosphate synthase
MNLIIIDKCSNYCKYCFAKNEINNASVEELNVENLNIFIKYIKKEKKSLPLNVIGGEPFLYKNLEYLLSILNKERKIENLTIFTGGLFKTNKLAALKKINKKCRLLFNVNQQEDYKNTKHFILVHKNIKYALELGIKVGIGFNIYRPDFNGDEIINYCLCYGVTNLRIAVSKPLFGDNNNVIFPAEYSSVSSKVSDFIINASKHNLKVDLDCTLPKCFFSDQDLGKIVKYQPDLARSLGKCEIAFDISPNLEIYRCFATSSIFRDRLTNYNTFSEAEQSLRNHVDEQISTPNIFDKCKECQFAFNKLCSGDCLILNMNDQIQIKPSELIEKAYKCLENKKLDEAAVYIDRLNMNNAANTLLTSYYYFYKNDIINAIRLARLTINLSTMESITYAATSLIKTINLHPEVKIKSL